MLKKIVFGLLILAATSIAARGSDEASTIHADILVVLPKKDSYDAQLLLESLRLQSLEHGLNLNVVFQEGGKISDLISDALNLLTFRCIVVMVDSLENAAALGELELDSNIPIIVTGYEPDTLPENGVFIGAQQDNFTILKEYILEKNNTVQNGIYLSQDQNMQEDVPENASSLEESEADSSSTQEPESNRKNQITAFEPLLVNSVFLDEDQKFTDIARTLDALITEPRLPPDTLIAETSSLALKTANYLHQRKLNETIPLFSLLSTPDVLQFIIDGKITAAVYSDYTEIAHEIFTLIKSLLDATGIAKSRYVAAQLLNAEMANSILLKTRQVVGTE